MKNYKYKIFVDVESTGLKGALNLIQYSINEDQKIYIFRPHKHKEHAEFFLKALNSPDVLLIGYNIGFDLFKLYQHYQPKEAFKCDCLDLYLHTLRGNPLNQFPARGKSIIQIKKVPFLVVDEFEKIIIKKLEEILKENNKFFQIKCVHSQAEKDRKDLVTLSFKLSFSLKLKELISKIFPNEKTLEYTDLWQLVDGEDTHISHVLPEEQSKYDFVFHKNEKELDNENSKCYEYAANDIKYLQMLENWLIEQENEIFFLNDIIPTLKLDENDFLTHIVAYTKFFGFSCNIEAIVAKKREIEDELLKIEKICEEKGIKAGSFKQKKELFLQYKTENALIPASFDLDHIKMILEYGWITGEGKELFEKILKFNSLNQRYKQLETIAKSAENFGRVYPDFKVFGTATNRLSGSGGINFQGISREQGIRELIYCSQGGDFDSLEIGIAASYFQDKQMLADLDNNVDLHTQTACLLNLFDMSYENAIALKSMNVKDLELEEDLKTSLKTLQNELKTARSKAKSINFAILYFATSMKIGQILNLDLNQAEDLMKKKFFAHYPQLLKNREIFQKNIVTVDTTTWSRYCIDNMTTSVVDAVGNVRNFSLEKKICKFFWENSKKIAKEVVTNTEKNNRKYSVQSNFLAEKEEGITSKKIVRQKAKGEQTIENAVYSSILGAVIGIQNTLYRQAGNYPIQSTGATYTKKLMVEIWDKYRPAMMNVHDEIIMPVEYSHIYNNVKEVVSSFIFKHKHITKHLSMDWKQISNWSEK